MAETRIANRNAHRRNVTRDRNLVSHQEWEIEQIHKQFPTHTHAEVKQAIAECKDALGGSSDRAKIMDCLTGRLSMHNTK